MLSLPEFILEGVPEGMQLKMQMEDPKALLSLPEFVREPVPTRSSPQPTPPPAIARRRSFRGLRSRSMSAPPLAWLLNTASRSTSPIAEGSEKEKERDKEKEKEPRRAKLGRTKRPGSSSGIPLPPPWQGELCSWGRHLGPKTSR